MCTWRKIEKYTVDHKSHSIPIRITIKEDIMQAKTGIINQTKCNDVRMSQLVIFVYILLEKAIYMIISFLSQVACKQSFGAKSNNIDSALLC